MDAVDLLRDAVLRDPRARDARTREVRIGAFWTVVRTSRGTGLASTMAREATPHEGPPVRTAGSLLDQQPLELLELLGSRSPTEAAVGLATANSLIARPTGHVTSDKALKILQTLAPNRTVAIVGRFPFVNELRPLCDPLWVFEKNLQLGQGLRHAHEIPDLVPGPRWSPSRPRRSSTAPFRRSSRTCQQARHS